MAKPTGPLLSLGASGQIGKTLVFGKWRGRPYVRQHVIPGNPQTAEQSLTRDTFSWLQSVYKVAPALFTAPWAAYAEGKAMTERNAFTKFNLPNLRPETDLLLMQGSPGALGGLPPASMLVTPGNDQLTVACTEPSPLPVGWSIVSATFAVIPDQDPASGILYQVTAATDVATPFSQVITGLISATLYECFAWLVYLRPDGKTAYSPSISATGLTT